MAEVNEYSGHGFESAILTLDQAIKAGETYILGSAYESRAGKGWSFQTTMAKKKTTRKKKENVQEDTLPLQEGGIESV